MNAISSLFELQGPQAALEKKYILEYLKNKGYCPRDLLKMSREDCRRLMTEASSLRLLKARRSRIAGTVSKKNLDCQVVRKTTLLELLLMSF